MIEPIIEPVATELIKAELSAGRFLRRTNKADNEIYVVDAHNSPNTMREIGRLREITFRDAGGGTGKEADIDRYDTMTPACQQLIVWNPEACEIIGGYRFILPQDIRITSGCQPDIATSHLFRFSERFMEEYMPYTLELGRSFVTPQYQSAAGGRKSIFALDNLWDGLGAMVVMHPELRYFFGKVTMYPSFDTEARDLILHFLNIQFGDKDNLVTPHRALRISEDDGRYRDLFSLGSVRDNYKALNTSVRALGVNIPPLVNAYMNLSSSMKMFGTAVNDDFGDVEETGILITLADIYDEKRERHINTFIPGEQL